MKVKHIETPLIESPTLKKRWNLGEVFLKLENSQATGSFKDRAMLSLCSHLKSKNVGKELTVVCSSGGNAGLAAAYACNKLGLSLHIFVPVKTKKLMLDRIAAFNEDAEIHKVGENWNEADAAAHNYINTVNEAGGNKIADYAPPFDNEYIFEGNSILVKEIREQLDVPNIKLKADYVVCSVGGGGLAGGILTGLSHVSEDQKVTLVCAETEGAASFRLAWGTNGEAYDSSKQVPSLDGINSIAHSLGARAVSSGFLNLASKHANVISTLVSDKESLQGVQLLLDEHRVLVEPACGAVFAAVDKMVREGLLDRSSRIVIVVCGGSCVNEKMLSDMKENLTS